MDSVRETPVLAENNNICDGAAEMFGQENDTTVAKVIWLSRKDNGKAYGSVAVYPTKTADVRRILEEGLFYTSYKTSCCHVNHTTSYIGIN